MQVEVSGQLVEDGFLHHHVGSRNPSQVVRLDRKHLWQLIHTAGCSSNPGSPQLWGGVGCLHLLPFPVFITKCRVGTIMMVVPGPCTQWPSRPWSSHAPALSAQWKLTFSNVPKSGLCHVSILMKKSSFMYSFCRKHKNVTHPSHLARNLPSTAPHCGSVSKSRAVSPHSPCQI